MAHGMELLAEENNMDYTVITTLITSVGFPICMCLVMAWYIKYVTDKHDEEMKQVTEALNNNTLALNELCNKLGE